MTGSTSWPCRSARCGALRGRRISMLLQDPFTMMNPLMKCGKHIEEMLRGDPRFAGRAAMRAEVVRRLAEVGIADPDVADRMPFQLSGGMCQRVAIAASLARDPELLIADEPSTALDVTTQAEIMKLLKRVQQARGMSLILITHDLRLAFSTCDRIHVLYAGSLLEVGDAPAVAARSLPSLYARPAALRAAGRSPGAEADRHPRPGAPRRCRRRPLRLRRSLRLGAGRNAAPPSRRSRRWRRAGSPPASAGPRSPRRCAPCAIRRWKPAAAPDDSTAPAIIRVTQCGEDLSPAGAAAASAR